MSLQEQQRLSHDYSALKEKYDRMRRINDSLTIDNISLKKKNSELIEENTRLRVENMDLKEDKPFFVELPNLKKMQYVSMKSYNKQRAIADQFVKLYWEEKDKNKQQTKSEIEKL